MMADVSTPAAIGRLRIERQLGAGGFATVWLGHDPELDAPVAVKILAENFAAHADIRRRFVDEARLLRRVDSDHLVRVYDVGELPDGRPFFVMTFADRGSLAQRMVQTPPPWPAPAVIAVVDAVADGLTVLHRHGVVHRDLKPVNILLRADPDGRERVLLGDLGIAKDLQWASGLTMPAGSTGYAAPEQEAYSQQIGPATDVHALAVTAGQLLGLTPPWPSTALGAVLSRATAPDPVHRTPSALAFVSELRESLAASGPPSSSGPPAPPMAPTEVIPPPIPGVPLPGVPSPTGETSSALAQRSRWSRSRLVLPAASLVVLLTAGAAWFVTHRAQHLASADGRVSFAVPRDLAQQDGAPFPGGTDARVGVRASAGSRSVAAAINPGVVDVGEVLTLVQPQGCTPGEPQIVQVGSWNGRNEHFTGCPDGSTVDEVVLNGGGSNAFTVWVEVRSTSGNPVLKDILASLDVSPD